MERFRQPDLRHKTSVSVEGKTFDLVNQIHSSGQILVVEKGPNGIFRGNISVSSVRWLGKLLCQISIEENDPGTTFKTLEEKKAVTGTVRRNRGGYYLQVLIVNRRGRKNYQSLCFPADANKKGWSLMGTALRMFVDPIPQQVNQQVGGSMDLHADQERRNSYVTYAEMCNTYLNRRKNGNGVFVNSSAGVLHASWWLSTVICTTDCCNPDWQWVESSIKGVFDQANLKIIEEGGALVFLNSPADVSKIINMPPLSTWNGSFSFHKWTPETGSIDISKEEREVELTFLGIPFHLRTTSVVSQLAEQCGSIISVEDGAITSQSQVCKAKVKSKEVAAIPRSIRLEERGYVFTVLVDFNVRRVIGFLEKKHYHQINGGVMGTTTQVPRVVLGQMLASKVVLGGTSSEQSVAPGFSNNRVVILDDQVEGPSQENQWHRVGPSHVHASPLSRVADSPITNMGLVANRFSLLSIGPSGGLNDDQNMLSPGLIFDPASIEDESSPLISIYRPISNDDEGESNRRQKRKNGRGANSIRQFKQLWRHGGAVRGRSRSKSRSRTILRRELHPNTQVVAHISDQDVNGNFETSTTDLSGEDSRTKLGMTTFLGVEGQTQMLTKLARDEKNGSEGNQIAIEGGETQTGHHSDVNCAHREPFSSVQTNLLSSTVGNEVVVSEGHQQMGVIAESIYNGKTKEDKGNFVEFFVIPLAKELGMTTSMSKEGKKRMFNEIASQSQWKDHASQMENKGVDTILALTDKQTPVSNN